MKNLLVAAAAVAAALTLDAASYDAATKYVNCNLDDYTGHNGSTPELAYETIQQAIDNAPDNSTIIVYPGEYNKGNGRGTNLTHWWGRARIHIQGKSLYIKSLEGAAKTHIVGQLGPKERGYLGDRNDLSLCYRCIEAEMGPTSEKEIIVEGFTLRDGATNERYGETPGHGAAMMCTDGSSPSYGLALVDCVISNCYASYSLVYGGSLVRCHLTKNDLTRSPIRSSGEPRLFSSAHVINSLVSDNIKFSPEGALGGASVPLTGNIVNTSFVNNRMEMWASAPTYWYNMVFSLSKYNADDGGGTTDHHINCQADSTDKRLLMSPAHGDIRVRATGLADGTGDAKWLSGEDVDLGMPSAVDRYKDFYGNAIPKTGAINIGCCQTTVTPQHGCIRADSQYASFDGLPWRHYWHSAYAYPDAYPTNYTMRILDSPDGKFMQVNLSGVTVAGYGTGGTARRYPNLKGELAVIPPPNVDDVLTLSPFFTKNVKYADPSADAATADGSEEHPYPTLEAAIVACTNSTSFAGLVLVKPGVYDAGWGTTDSGLKVRIWLRGRDLLVRGVEGAEKTIVKGAPDPVTGSTGSGATLLIAMTGTAAVQGLTLTGGYSGEDVWTSAAGRGPIYSYGQDLRVVDCIITNNVGHHYAIGTAYFERCRIFGNTGGSGLTIGSKIVSCVIGGTTLTGADAKFLGAWNAYNCQIFSTSFAGDGVHAMWGTPTSDLQDSPIVNSVIAKAAGTPNVKGGVAGCVFDGFPTTVEGAVSADPMLMDLPNGDARPFSLSPALTAGVAPTGEGAAASWWYGCTMDVNGDPWTFDALGRPVAGAEQEVVSGGVYVSAGAGGLTVEGGRLGVNPLDEGETLTFGFAAGATRPLVGMVMNGVTNRFDAAHRTLTFTKGEGDEAVIALYSNAWVVDAEHGDDGNLGYNEACPFKTLQKALEYEGLLPGDRVLALPGTYRGGKMSVGAGYAVKARAVVPYDVTLESRDGAAVTFIEGAPSDVDDRSTSDLYNQHIAGMGKNAVRGVYLKEAPSGHAPAVVRGFTVTNCYVRGAKDDGGGGHGNAEYCGAGVAGYGRAERCVFVDGHAFRGGGAYLSTSVDCIFHHNMALYGGGATTDAKQYGCVSYDNVCVGTTYWGGFFYWQAVDNCTVADSVSGCMGGKGYAMRNTLVTGYIGNWDLTPTSECFTNCVVDVAKTVSAAYMTAIAGAPGCIVTNAAALQVDADFRPVVGANAAIDRADETISQYVGETDALGGQRVYNGRRDVGALEADWRPVYAADIRRKQLTVETASPNVTESDAKGVLLPDAAELTGTLSARDAAEYLFEAKVPAGGTLTLTFNGEAVEPVAGEDGRMQYVVNAAEGDNELAFAYAGEGSAEILRSHKNSGMYLFVR